MKTIYTKGWSIQKKRCLEIISKDDAEKLYKKRKSVGVVIENGAKPFCFIDFGNRFIHIGFLDNFKRNYLSYDFLIYNMEKIFLQDVYLWEYESETDNKTKVTQFSFTTEGEYTVEHKIYKTNKIKETRKDYYEKINISVLWENYPEFDKYNEIIKERKEIFINAEII